MTTTDPTCSPVAESGNAHPAKGFSHLLLLAPHLALVACCALAGCQQPKATRIELTAYDESGTPKLYVTQFSRSSYRHTAGETVELVLRAEQPSTIDPTQTITQVLYIKEFWNPRPGTTYVEPSQINARVQYALLTPPTGVRYDGAAFLTYQIDPYTGVLTGAIESGSLAPRYRMGEAFEPFGPSTFTGTIVATENAADVVEAAQMLESLFGKRSNAK